MRRCLACVSIALIAITVLPSPADAARRNYRGNKAIRKAAQQQPAVEEKKKSAADPLVASALRKQLEGDTESHLAYLKEALDRDPNLASAHWHLGELQVDGQWLTIDNAATRHDDANLLHEYRSRRLAMPASVEGHIDLASWCETVGLHGQRRAHLLAALGQQPKNSFVLKQLGLSNRQGQLIPTERLAQLRSKELDDTLAAKRWRYPINALRAPLTTGKGEAFEKARDELVAIGDPMAVPLMETILSSSSESAALAVVEALSNMPHQVATNSLVRHAVLSTYKSVRRAAVDVLKNRSYFTWVPQLVAELKSPVRTYASLYCARSVSAGLHTTVLYEGPFASYSLVRSDLLSLSPNPRSKQIGPIEQALPRLYARSNQIFQAAASHNATADELNERIGAALLRATEADDERPYDEPSRWWSWWLDYNDIYEPPPYQVTEYRTTTEYIQPYRVGGSCFIGGTPISTSAGSIAIEHAQVGDLVLAQDIESGELAFKPVTGVTVRPATRVLAIQTDDDHTVTATRGHPFWVAGHGWRMAKELKVGDRLHRPAGSTVITGIDEPPPEKAYNLFVADFSTYFVGENRLLVHDNTMRQPTEAVLPGLVNVVQQREP